MGGPRSRVMLAQIAMAMAGRVSLAIGVMIGAASHALADSDLAVACGDRFAVFDRFESAGRMLGVIPFVDSGPLAIASAVRMPEAQPHRWAVYRDYAVVRTWNEVQIYRIDQKFNAAMLGRFLIDDSRPNVGGTTAIELKGSVLRAYGVKNMLELDLVQCSAQCKSRTIPVTRPPAEPTRRPRCSAVRGNFIFSESEALSDNVGGIIYHDVLVTRRRRPADVPDAIRHRVDSILYLGTSIETID
jgi:hypothetical protein